VLREFFWQPLLLSFSYALLVTQTHLVATFSENVVNSTHHHGRLHLTYPVIALQWLMRSAGVMALLGASIPIALIAVEELSTGFMWLLVVFPLITRILSEIDAVFQTVSRLEKESGSKEEFMGLRGAVHHYPLLSRTIPLMYALIVGIIGLHYG
jgi:hypothetical protein